MSVAEQVLIRELKAIDIKINNVDSFFGQAELNPEVDPMALYELMEMDGIEKTQLVEEAYARFHAAES